MTSRKRACSGEKKCAPRSGVEPTTTTLFTIGYEGRTVEEFEGILQSMGVRLLVDVRQIPNSRKPGFSRGSICRRLEAIGIEYDHFRELGSPQEARKAYREDGDKESFVTAYERHLLSVVDHLDRLAELASKKPTAIMCFERDVSNCHRGIIADRLGEKGFEIRNI